MNEIYTDLEKESTTKTVFASGAVRDGGNKEDYIETISYLALGRFAKYMTSKQTTYGQGNWRKGIPVESYEKSLMRHLQKYLANKYDGASLEPEEDHLAAALFNLQGLLHEEERLRQTLAKTPITTGNSNVRGSITLVHTPSKGEAIEVEAAVVESLRSSGFTVQEIASMTGVSERTVYRRLAGGN